MLENISRMRSFGCYDPYDIWATSLGLSVRSQYYAGRVSGKVSAVVLGLLDWLLPIISRKVVSAKQLQYPIVVAHEALYLKINQKQRMSFPDLLISLRELAVSPGGKPTWAWGLGFPWMSKNGLYGPDIPFVTHTPYVMEALLALAEQPELHDEAMSMFHGTLTFLESLKIMHRGMDDLALSYAPVDEPRMVVNANAYTAFAYGLHAVHGREEIRENARERAVQLMQWVIRQQQNDGSWWYYADEESGNFIDCFHSCFVVKNLCKVYKLVPETAVILNPVIERGWAFIRSMFYDDEHRLCRRFSRHAQHDPFRWDLYDQAEYLGLLVDFGLLGEASAFTARVEKKFKKGDDWYCRIDILGRRWGKNFLRWGVVPFWYHRARMNGKIYERNVGMKI